MNWRGLPGVSQSTPRSEVLGPSRGAKAYTDLKKKNSSKVANRRDNNQLIKYGREIMSSHGQARVEGKRAGLITTGGIRLYL